MAELVGQTLYELEFSGDKYRYVKLGEILKVDLSEKLGHIFLFKSKFMGKIDSICSMYNTLTIGENLSEEWSG